MVSFEERNAVDLSKNRDRLPFIVFFSLMALLAWKITAPLMMALMWSGMLAFTVMPLYKKINSFLGGKFSGIASVITLFIMIFSVIAPLLAILVTLGSEVSHLTSTVTGFLAQIEPNELKNPVELLPASFPSWARDYFASFLSDGASVRAFLQRAAQWTGAFLTALSKNLIMSASSVLFEIMVVLMTSFFFIRDGEKIVSESSPSSVKRGEPRIFQTHKRHTALDHIRNFAHSGDSGFLGSFGLVVCRPCQSGFFRASYVPLRNAACRNCGCLVSRRNLPLFDR